MRAYDKPENSGWLTFAAAMMAIGGIVSVIDGVAALTRSQVFAADVTYVVGSLRTWGVVHLVLGVLIAGVGFAVLARRQWARWTGIGLAGLSMIGQFVAMAGNPRWAVIVIAVDVLVIYALAVYGGAEEGSAG
jgi:hypothetical protein